MENAQSDYVTVSIDFDADAWEFWDAVEEHPAVNRLCFELRCLLLGDREEVRIRRAQAAECMALMSSVKGWNTGNPDAPFPLLFSSPVKPNELG